MDQGKDLTVLASGGGIVEAENDSLDDKVLPDWMNWSSAGETAGWSSGLSRAITNQMKPAARPTMALIQNEDRQP